jgi:PilZ domain
LIQPGRRLSSGNAALWRHLRAKWASTAHELWSTTTATDGSEQRAQDRFKIWGALAFCRCALGPQEAETLAVVEDASETGLYIASHLPPPVGTLLEVKIYSQAGKRGGSVIQLTAKVRWCRSLHQPTGVGVEILDFADGKRGLAAWLALLPDSATPR